MEAKTVEQAAEMAADLMIHFMYELGSESRDADNAASDIYEYITGKQLDVENVLGVDPDDLEYYDNW